MPCQGHGRLCDHARIRRDSWRALDYIRSDAAKKKVAALLVSHHSPHNRYAAGFHPITWLRLPLMPGPSKAAMDLAWSYAKGAAWWSTWLFKPFQTLWMFLVVSGEFSTSPKYILELMIYFLLLVYLISKAPCTEIIERATSIVDYDLRDEKRSPDTAASVTRVCPVLHDLYQADLSMSDS